jgi:hypothetical protein
MYEPDASDELPWPVPTTSTFAPAKGFPSLSVTIPEIDCANKKDVVSRHVNNRTTFFIVYSFIVFII